MKKLLTSYMLGASLLLSACGTTGGLTSDQIDALVADIKAQCAKVCSYRPQAASVASLIAAFFPGAGVYVDIVNTVSSAICQAPVTSAAVQRGVTVVTRIVQTPKGPVAVQGTSYGGGGLK